MIENQVDPEVARLLAWIGEMRRIPSEEWMNSLTPRQRNEMEFHDKTREQTSEVKAVAQDTYSDGGAEHWATIASLIESL